MGDAACDRWRYEVVVARCDDEYRTAHAPSINPHARDRHVSSRPAAIRNELAKHRRSLLCGNVVEHERREIARRRMHDPRAKDGRQVLELPQHERRREHGDSAWWR